METEQITNDRLNKWKRRLAQSHATPLLLVGVGHDWNIGKLVLCTLDEQEIGNDVMRAILLEVLAGLPA